MKNYLAIIVTIVIILFCQPINAQTTEFTYQGALEDGTGAANGNYDFEFSAYFTLTGATQAGSTITINNVVVSKGVFTVQLDFGDVVVNGGVSYLEINVRQTGGGAFTPLTPRQPISTTPYAQKSLRANMANLASNSNQFGGFVPTDFTFTTDPRLSDARTPAAGSNNYIQNRTTTQSTANFNINGTETANIFNAGTQFDLANNRILSSPGTNNTFVGISTGTAITSGTRNTFVGRNTGSNTDEGNRNTFVGSGAGFENISGSDNSFYGYNAGLRVTSGSSNSIFGVSAGGKILTGFNNAFFGYESGLNATGSGNSFFGSLAGRSTTSGIGNAFFGAASGDKNSIGASNVFFGESTGRNNTEGNENSFVGRTAGINNITGSSNSFFGFQAGFENFTGSNNSFIGRDAGIANTIGDNNTAIGSGANFSGNNFSFATAVGAGAVATLSGVIQLGRDGLDVVRIGKLGPDGLATDPLCYSATRTISLCPSNLSSKELKKQIDQQAEENQQLQTKVKTQQQQADRQQAISNLQTEKLNKQEDELEALKLLVCSQSPTATLCAKKEV